MERSPNKYNNPAATFACSIDISDYHVFIFGVLTSSFDSDFSLLSYLSGKYHVNITLYDYNSVNAHYHDILYTSSRAFYVSTIGPANWYTIVSTNLYNFLSIDFSIRDLGLFLIFRFMFVIIYICLQIYF